MISNPQQSLKRSLSSTFRTKFSSTMDSNPSPPSVTNTKDTNPKVRLRTPGGRGLHFVLRNAGKISIVFGDLSRNSVFFEPKWNVAAFYFIFVGGEGRNGRNESRLHPFRRQLFHHLQCSVCHDMLYMLYTHPYDFPTSQKNWISR